MVNLLMDEPLQTFHYIQQTLITIHLMVTNLICGYIVEEFFGASDFCLLYGASVENRKYFHQPNKAVDNHLN